MIDSSSTFDKRTEGRTVLPEEGHKRAYNPADYDRFWPLLISTPPENQLLALKAYSEILQGDDIDAAIADTHDECQVYFLGYAMAGITPEIQAYALFCLRLAFERSQRHLNLEPLNRSNVLDFFINALQMNYICAINSLKILSILYSELIDVRQPLLEKNIIPIILSLPDEMNSGELLLIILRNMETPDPIIIQALINFVDTSNPNSANLIYGLSSIEYILSINYPLDDSILNNIHGKLPIFLESSDPDIISAAFDVLKHFTDLTQYDFQAISNLILHQDDNKVKDAIRFFCNISSKITMPPNLSNLMTNVISTRSHICIKYAIDLVSLCISELEITPELVACITERLSTDLKHECAIALARIVSIKEAEKPEWLTQLLNEEIITLEDLKDDMNQKTSQAAQFILNYLESIE